MLWLLIAVAFCCGARALGCSGFGSCAFWALEHRLTSCAWVYLPLGVWNLPRPEVKPVLPVLTGEFSTFASPGKSWGFERSMSVSEGPGTGSRYTGT